LNVGRISIPHKPYQMTSVARHHTCQRIGAPLVIVVGIATLVEWSMSPLLDSL
jgi:hypothetical protein